MKRLLPRLGDLMLLLFLLWGGQLTAQPIHRIGKAMPGADSILPQPYLALTNANVLDVRTGEILENRTVVLQDGLIQSITTGAPPQGADVQNVNGYYMLPGFFDGHFHGRTLDAAQFALESGVTTVLSAGAYGMQDMTFRDAVTAGYFPGPDMLAAGVFVLRHLGDNALEDPRLFKFMNVELEGAENLRRVVQVNFERGVDWIKTRVGGNTAAGVADAYWLYYTEEEVAAMADKAARYGGKIQCHIQSGDAAIVAARAGCATLEHGQYINEEALRVMRELGTVWTPTYISTEGFALPHDDYNTPTARRVAPWILENQRRMLRTAHELGVTMVTAVDTPYGPESVARLAGEINAFIDYGGMTPLEAIQAATITSAEVYGLDGMTGSIEEGKEADIVLFERNPLEEPLNLHNAMMVISNGRIAVPFRSAFPALNGRPDRSY